MYFDFTPKSVILLIFFLHGLVFSVLLLVKVFQNESKASAWLSLFSFYPPCLFFLLCLVMLGGTSNSLTEIFFYTLLFNNYYFFRPYIAPYYFLNFSPSVFLGLDVLLRYRFRFICFSAEEFGGAIPNLNFKALNPDFISFHKCGGCLKP